MMIYIVFQSHCSEVFQVCNGAACGLRNPFSVGQEASLDHGSFVDVGSGLGKLVVAAACASTIPCFGVEISPFRCLQVKDRHWCPNGWMGIFGEFGRNLACFTSYSFRTEELKGRY